MTTTRDTTPTATSGSAGAALPLTIAETRTALREHEITVTQVVAASVAAAEAHDAALGIYVERYDETALAAAAEADARYAAGDETAPRLLGIPFGIKDIITTTEGITTGQSLVGAPAWGAQGTDAPVVARLRAAGGIVTGKTTTMEFATGLPDLAKPFPVPRNPWNPDYWPGGSSSGTANGVAAGAFLAGLGTDTGGSIRIPAAFCGITGLKATFGRVPKSGCMPLGYTLDHIGPMARSAEDCALMLEVIAGHDPSDPQAAAEPVTSWTASLTGDLGGLRIGIDVLEDCWEERDPDLTRLLSSAVDTLTSLGAEVVPVSLPLYDELSAAARVTSRSEALAYHLPDLRTRWDDYFASTRTGLGTGAYYSGADYVQAQRVRRVGQLAVAELMADLDVVVTPTASVGGFRVDDLPRLALERMGAMHTTYWNAVGNPALTVPIGLGAAGLPLAMQIAGRPFDEATVLRVGDAYQRVTAFHLAQPPARSQATDGGGPVPAG